MIRLSTVILLSALLLRAAIPLLPLPPDMMAAPPQNCLGSMPLGPHSGSMTSLPPIVDTFQPYEPTSEDTLKSLQRQFIMTAEMTKTDQLIFAKSNSSEKMNPLIQNTILRLLPRDCARHAGAAAFQNNGRSYLIVNSTTPSQLCVAIIDLQDGTVRNSTIPTEHGKCISFLAGNDWLVCRGHKLYTFPITQPRFTPKVTPLPANDVSAITRDKDGNLWLAFGNKGTIYQLNSDSKSVIPGPILQKRCTCLTVNNANWLYATTQGCIFTRNPSDGKVTRHPQNGSCIVSYLDGQDVLAQVRNKYFRLNKNAFTPTPFDITWNNRPESNQVNEGFIRSQLPDGRRVIALNTLAETITIREKDGTLRPLTFHNALLGDLPLAQVKAGSNQFAIRTRPLRIYRLKGDSYIREGMMPEYTAENVKTVTVKGTQIFLQEDSGRLWCYDTTRPFHAKSNTLEINGMDGDDICAQTTNGKNCSSRILEIDHEGNQLRLAFFKDEVGNDGICQFKVKSNPDNNFLRIVPFRSPAYCKVQFMLDGKDIGKPYNAAGEQADNFHELIFGPFNLKPGKHTVALRLLTAKSKQPGFCSLLSARFTTGNNPENAFSQGIPPNPAPVPFP